MSEARFPLKIDWERVQALPEWQRGGSLAVLDAPLVCFPLKLEWTALHPEAPEVFPAPLRHSDASGGTPNHPDGVSKIQTLAERAGWSVLVTYAQGWMPHSTHGRPSAGVKSSWALRMTRGEQRAVAVHRDGAWSSLWHWSSSSFFVSSPTLTDFTDQVFGVLCDRPSAIEWTKMLVKYPLKPTRKQMEEMRILNEACRGVGR